MSQIPESLKETIENAEHEEILEDILTSKAFAEYLPQLFRYKLQSLTIEAIEFKIFNREAFQTIKLTPRMNLCNGDAEILRLVLLLVRLVFLDDVMSDARHLIEEYSQFIKRPLEPEIKIYLKIDRNRHKLQYNFNRGSYQIDDEVCSRQTDYQRALASLLQYADKPNLIRPPTANTRFSFLRKTFFLDFRDYNPIAKDENGKRLYFDSYFNIQLKLLEEFVDDHLHKIGSDAKDETQKIRDRTRDKNALDERLRGFDSILQISRKFKEMGIDYPNKADLDAEIEIISKKILSLLDVEEIQHSIDVFAIKIREIGDEMESLNRIVRMKNGERARLYDERQQLLQSAEAQSLVNLRLEKRKCFCLGELPEGAIKRIGETKICPICGKPIPFLDNKENIDYDAKIVSLNREINTAKTIIEKTESKLKERGDELAETKTRLDDAFSKREDILKDATRQKEKADLEPRLEALKAYKFQYDFIQTALKQVESTRLQREEITRSIQEAQSHVDEVSRQEQEIRTFKTFLSEYILTNDRVRNSLDKQFGQKQADFVRPFLRNTIFDIRPAKGFQEISIQSGVQHNYITLIYYLSLLSLAIDNNDKGMKEFHSFPFLVINNIDHSLKSEDIDRVCELMAVYKDRDYQLLMFSPDSEGRLPGTIGGEVNVCTLRNHNRRPAQQSFAIFGLPNNHP